MSTLANSEDQCCGQLFCLILRAEEPATLVHVKYESATIQATSTAKLFSLNLRENTGGFR